MSEIRIEQYAAGGFDGRATVEMPALPMTANAITLASAASPAASAPLSTLARLLWIEPSGGNVAVTVAAGTDVQVAALLPTPAAGASIRDGQGRWFAIPTALHGKNDVRVAVIDR